jgi:hypothetical protein
MKIEIRWIVRSARDDIRTPESFRGIVYHRATERPIHQENMA